MTCEICRSQLVDRLAGALPSPALEAVEDHLVSCAACAAEAAELDAA